MDPAALLESFLPAMRASLKRLPDYVCQQTVERFSRFSSERPWDRLDVQRWEVAMVGGRELYARPDSDKFQDQPLADMIGRGTVSTGQFGMLARHVFAARAEDFRYRGASEPDGRRAFEFEYDIAPAKSTYRLRVGKEEAIVGFQGAFWIDAQTRELLKLEVQAYDIPERVSLSEVITVIDYARRPVGGAEVLLPATAALTVTGTDGSESLNRTRLTGCRQFQTESTIRFGGGEAMPAVPAAAPVSREQGLPAGTQVEVTLDADFDPAKAVMGDAVRARVIRVVSAGTQTAVPAGTSLTGRVVRLEKESNPFEMWEIGWEFDTLEMGGRGLPFEATLLDAGPAPGLLRQAKRLDPVFTRRRTKRMNILVREIQPSQAILHWDARRGGVPRGLRLKWRIAGAAPDER